MASGNYLTPAQQRALVLLSAGSTARAAAQSIGVHRNTVGNWLRSNAFREALLEIRRNQDLVWREQIRSLAGQALAAIQAVLADPHAPAAVRLEAALAIHGSPHLESRAQSPAPAAPKRAAQPGRNQPCPCGSGRKFKRCCMSPC
ncbi:MAG: SEC-C metal-binding domain-containing protein [Bryobacteraceae bacterium]|jgi:preprotein translocase subunit SecA